MSDALAAVGQHHRQIADHPAGIRSTTPLLDSRQSQRQRLREPELVGHLGEQRAARARDQARSVRVTSTVTGRPSRVTFKGEPPQARSSTVTKPKGSPAQPDVRAPRRAVAARSGLMWALLRTQEFME
jgi:hypothetical protein